MLLAADSEKTKFSSYLAQMSELDMIQNAKDLNQSQKESIIQIYRGAKKQKESIHKEMEETKGQLLKALLDPKRDSKKEKQFINRLNELNEKELDVTLASMGKMAEIVRGSDLDRDYFYRAILREQRRTSSRP